MTLDTLDGRSQQPHEAFRHEAMMYRDEAEFLDRTSSFIRDGVDAGEPVLVVVSAAKIAGLCERLGADADAVCFADMAEVGKNPARIMPAWRDFVDAYGSSGRRLRGVGEPIHPGRTPAETVECHRHEALLNVAFADAPAWWLLCPCDVSALDPAVIQEVRRNHPHLSEDGEVSESAAYPGLDDLAAPFDDPLPGPAEGAFELSFGFQTALITLRQAVLDRASVAGVDPDRADDLVLAVSELATNSLRHGGGHGTLGVWDDDHAFICEVRDGGRIAHPLAGRERPPRDRDGGQGLWLVNQLCDLVQVRSFPSGSVVRLHVLHALNGSR